MFTHKSFNVADLKALKASKPDAYEALLTTARSATFWRRRGDDKAAFLCHHYNLLKINILWIRRPYFLNSALIGVYKHDPKCLPVRQLRKLEAKSKR